MESPQYRYELIKEIAQGLWEAKIQRDEWESQCLLRIPVGQHGVAGRQFTALCRRYALFSEHPNFPKIFQYGRWNGKLFCAFEALQGITLSKAVAKQRKLLPGSKLLLSAMLREVSRALLEVQRELECRHLCLPRPDPDKIILSIDGRVIISPDNILATYTDERCRDAAIVTARMLYSFALGKTVRNLPDILPASLKTDYPSVHSRIRSVQRATDVMEYLDSSVPDDLPNSQCIRALWLERYEEEQDSSTNFEQSSDLPEVSDHIARTVQRVVERDVEQSLKNLPKLVKQLVSRQLATISHPASASGSSTTTHNAHIWLFAILPASLALSIALGAWLWMAQVPETIEHILIDELHQAAPPTRQSIPQNYQMATLDGFR